jgi:shikimate kinase
MSAPTSGRSTPIITKKRRLDTTSSRSSFDARASPFGHVVNRTRENDSISYNDLSSSHRTTHDHQSPRARPGFGRDASLVLIGTKGSGLSSFAVIAAKTLRFRLIDTETWLVERHGLHKSDYVKDQGLEAYRKISSKALEAILQQHGTGHVLVCGPEALEPHSQSLIRAFALTHPVVMINRDLTEIRKYLGLADVAGVLQILGQSQRICRKISNLEFFNLPESEAASPLSAELSRKLRRGNQTLHSPSLLQNVKQDFLHFLSRLGVITSKPAASLLGSSPPYREYSTLLTLRLEDVARGDSSLVDLDCGNDAIELAVRCCQTPHIPFDWDSISRSLQVIRRKSGTPIVYHVECDEPRSLETRTCNYAHLISHGLRLLPEFITISLTCTDRQIHDLTSSVGNRTKVIGHRSYSRKSSSLWKDPVLHKEFDRAVALGCHVVRFIQHVESTLEDRDCVAFQASIAARSEIPLIAYTTGNRPTMCMLFNSCLTSVRKPKALDLQAVISPLTPPLTLQQLVKARCASFVYQPLRLFIFGASIDYSLSPTMHNAAFAALGFEHTYTIKQSPYLRDFVPLVDDNFGGASVSLPFKSEVLPLLDSTSEAARIIQAVNTVLPFRVVSNADSSISVQLSRSNKNRAGTVFGLHGENTDWTAIYSCISRYLSPANAISSSSSALIIGAGGMARASVYALLRMGVRNVVLWNRTHGKAVEIAEHFNTLLINDHSKQPDQQTFPQACGTPQSSIKVVETLDSPWPERLAQPTMVVCTIPAHQIGATPPPEFTIPLQWFSSRTGGVIVEVSDGFVFMVAHG